MKKSVKALAFVLAVLLLFSSCAKAPQTKEPQGETEIPQSSAESDISQEKSETKAEIFAAENGKYGIKDENGKIIVEAVYDSIALSETPEVFSFEAKITEGTRPAVKYDEYDSPYLTEVPNELFWILDENGKPVIDIAFEYYLLEKNPSGGENWWILGVAEGYSYQFEETGGVFVLTEKVGTEESENEFGYTVTSYCYHWYAGYGHGLKLGDEVILEPVYKSMVDMPFEDRIIVYDGEFPSAGPECRVAKIIDPEGNVYSRIFNDVSFSVMDDGSYIGVAYSCGDECEVPPYYGMDYLPEGYWFIDRDGNILSERFIELPNKFENFDAVITATNENGEEIEVFLGDYVLNQ